MKLACEVVFTKFTKTGTSRPTKKTRGFIILSKEKDKVTNEDFYEMQFVVSSDMNGYTFRLDPDNMPKMVPTITDNKKCSFTFPSKPPIVALVSNVDSVELYTLMKILRDIGAGEPVEVMTKEKIRVADFKPKKIVVSRKHEYETKVQRFSSFLETLVIHPIDMRRGDSRWSTCTNLLSLDVSGNTFGLCRDLESLTSALHPLHRLRSLDLSSCRLGRASSEEKALLFKSLPATIINLTLTENTLEVFPQIFHLRDLQYLNLSNNRIRFCPSRILEFVRLQVLDISTNRFKFLPFLAPDQGTHLPNLRLVNLDQNEGLVDEDVGLHTMTVSLLHPFGEEFTRDGVDTLQTIAAHACHQNENLLEVSRDFLPRELQIGYMDYYDESSAITSMDFCYGCRSYTHVRCAQVSMYPTRRWLGVIDVVNRCVRFVKTFCRGCVERVRSMPDDVWENYWVGEFDD